MVILYTHQPWLDHFWTLHLTRYQLLSGFLVKVVTLYSKIHNIDSYNIIVLECEFSSPNKHEHSRQYYVHTFDERFNLLVNGLTTEIMAEPLQTRIRFPEASRFFSSLCVHVVSPSCC